ncbi:MAG: hypothetical protein WC682_05375 [Parcubacteria group bacterium]|jgi:hypothetical protein
MKLNILNFKKYLFIEKKGSCPYCNKEIMPFPTKGKKCSFCGKKYRVRKFPNESVPRIIKEEDIVALEDLWAKHYYIKEAGDEDLKRTEYDEIDRIIIKAKKAYKAGRNNEAWGLYNKATLEAIKGKYFNGQAYLSKQWSIFRSMAIQLMAEEKYVDAVVMLLRVAVLDTVSYGNEKEKDGFITAIAPATLEMTKEAIDRGKIQKEKFLELLNRAIDITNNFVKTAKMIDKKAFEGLDNFEYGVKDLNEDLFKKQVMDYFLK